MHLPVLSLPEGLQLERVVLMKGLAHDLVGLSIHLIGYLDAREFGVLRETEYFLHWNH